MNEKRFALDQICKRKWETPAGFTENNCLLSEVIPFGTNRQLDSEDNNNTEDKQDLKQQFRSLLKLAVDDDGSTIGKF